MIRRSRPVGARVLTAAAAVALVPQPAEAHLVTTGLGPIYDGISHVVMSPDDLVPILAMAMLAGVNGAVAGRRTLFSLTTAWLLGGAIGFVVGRPLESGATSVSFLALGVLLATDVRLSSRVVMTLAIAVGLLHGWLNGAGIAADQREAMGLVGIVGAIFVLAALGSALVVSLRRPAARIAVRVAGSWVAATGVLMLGWRLRGLAG